MKASAFQFYPGDWQRDAAPRDVMIASLQKWRYSHGPDKND